jgi:hypothetical protein
VVSTSGYGLLFDRFKLVLDHYVMYNEAKSKYQEEQPMKDQNCGYCMRGELLDAFGIYICDLSVSTLILFKEQSHPGRCIVAYKDHVSEIVNISDEERNAFFADVNRAAKAIHAAFHPDKVNYGAYGDTGCHLHMHLVPKYKDEFEWGGVFAMNPGKTYLTEEQYAEMIEKIKANL